MRMLDSVECNTRSKSAQGFSIPGALTYSNLLLGYILTHSINNFVQLCTCINTTYVFVCLWLISCAHAFQLLPLCHTQKTTKHCGDDGFCVCHSAERCSQCVVSLFVDTHEFNNTINVFTIRPHGKIANNVTIYTVPQKHNAHKLSIHLRPFGTSYCDIRRHIA